MNGPALALIAECRRLGINIAAEGDRLCYWPTFRMPRALAARIRANMPAVLAILSLTRARTVGDQVCTEQAGIIDAVPGGVAPGYQRLMFEEETT